MTVANLQPENTSSTGKRIIVEIRGGSLVAIHSDHPLNYTVVDWDCIQESGELREIWLAASGQSPQEFQIAKQEICNEFNG